MGSSKYCMVTTFISALMTLLCGMTPACTQDSEGTVNIVLAIGPYRAQCFMLSHCARLLLERLPDDRRELLLSMSQLQTGTTASQGGSTTRHTIFMLPCLLHKWTEFACKTDTTLIAVSRHIEKLCLIRPWDLCRNETPPEARRLHDLFEEHAFFHAPAYTLTRLAQEVLDVVCEVDAECWVLNAFNAWQEHHTALVDRPQELQIIFSRVTGYSTGEPDRYCAHSRSACSICFSFRRRRGALCRLLSTC